MPLLHADVLRAPRSEKNDNEVDRQIEKAPDDGDEKPASAAADACDSDVNVVDRDHDAVEHVVPGECVFRDVRGKIPHELQHAVQKDGGTGKSEEKRQRKLRL